MTPPELDGLDALTAEFGRTLARGETLPVAGHLIVIIEGRALALETAPAAGGTAAVVRRLSAGGFIGAECMLGDGSPLVLRALDAIRALVIPPTELAALYRAAPGYALHLTRAIYAEAKGRALNTMAGAAAAAPQGGSSTAAAAQRQEPGAGRQFHQTLSFNGDWFYADKTTCPACSTVFSHLRVRTRAVHSVKRESDFYLHYRSVNPLHYAITVCPNCRYAAYSDDFDKLTGAELRNIVGTADQRRTRTSDGDFRGERDLPAVTASFRLALTSYRARGSDAGRIAGLLHRLAWVARESGDEPNERCYLEEALQEYRRSYEMDRDVSDGKGVGLAYFIGEISLRLGRYSDAVQWFTLLTRIKESRRRPEILRLARERWADAREAMAKEKSRPADSDGGMVA